MSALEKNLRQLKVLLDNGTALPEPVWHVELEDALVTVPILIGWTAAAGLTPVKVFLPLTTSPQEMRQWRRQIRRDPNILVPFVVTKVLRTEFITLVQAHRLH